MDMQAHDTHELVEVDDAVAMVTAAAGRLGEQNVPLDDALHRALAGDVVAAQPVPPFDSSAMDGYAVRHADLAGASAERPVRLQIAGESRAGHPFGGALPPGQAVAISTGAVMPAAADAVVMVEQTHPDGPAVDVLAAVAAAANVRRAGDDIRAGHTVLRAGTILGPAQLGVLASLGHAWARCVRRPRVAILTTGDELVPPGRDLAPGAIHNSNLYSIAALVREAGGDVIAAATVPDDPQATRVAIGDALGLADVVVICGGVSVGSHDHVKPVLAQLGVRERFWGLALRPGKPTWFGLRDGGPLVFGLPGNPVSAMVTFTLLVAPALARLCGIAPARLTTTATLAADYDKAPGRAHAVRCTLELRDDGWHAHPTGDQSSHVLTSMLGAAALAIIPTASGPVRAGERVRVMLLDRARLTAGW